MLGRLIFDDASGSSCEATWPLPRKFQELVAEAIEKPSPKGIAAKEKRWTPYKSNLGKDGEGVFFLYMFLGVAEHGGRNIINIYHIFPMLWEKHECPDQISSYVNISTILWKKCMVLT